jgi:excisionase family DNA binding protein
MTLLKVPEVAKRLNVGVSTVYALIAQGKLAAYQVGPRNGGLRISEDDLQRYLQSCKLETDGPPLRTARPQLKHIRL